MMGVNVMSANYVNDYVLKNKLWKILENSDLEKIEFQIWDDEEYVTLSFLKEWDLRDFIFINEEAVELKSASDFYGGNKSSFISFLDEEALRKVIVNIKYKTHVDSEIILTRVESFAEWDEGVVWQHIFFPFKEMQILEVKDGEN